MHVSMYGCVIWCIMPLSRSNPVPVLLCTICTLAQALGVELRAEFNLEDLFVCGG